MLSVKDNYVIGFNELMNFRIPDSVSLIEDETYTYDKLDITFNYRFYLLRTNCLIDVPLHSQVVRHFCNY
ncbi:hypothetical protein [[Bacillus] enclensis]|uniref:hypothetical protein n=1 Tax=[Bacillus] enclensis TaxID=1402860 RepID=UPI0018DB1545|nr:hypothetical protein [[Bacillus] enclensis]MBH9968154.1 hypothetical protein [[Bacillus] enclensis]